MAEQKPKVTLIGKELAKTGLEFIYEGTIAACSPCKLNKACNNLKAGRRYRIVGVRPTEHPCLVHLNGTRAVEVVESPIPALLSADMAIRNTKIQFECSCNKEQCPNYHFCRPDGIIERDKYIVVNVIGSAPERCEKGRGLQFVELMPV
jgi:hypothetical protein